MKKKVSISIIIPAYNVEYYIEDCINSVLNQTCSFDEIIIVNDGSTDRTGEIVIEYKKNNPSIIYIEKENEGLSSARNIGIANASSDYILFLDSDDMLNQRTVEILKNKIDDQDVLAFSAEIKDDIPGVRHKNIYHRSDMFCRRYASGIEYFKEVYPYEFVVNAGMSVYRLDFIKANKIYFPFGLLYEDNLFYFMVILNAIRYEVINDRLYIRRYRQGSIMTSEMSQQKKRNQFEIDRRIFNYLCTYINSDIDFSSFVKFSCLRVLYDYNLLEDNDCEETKAIFNSMKENFLKLMELRKEKENLNFVQKVFYNSVKGIFYSISDELKKLFAYIPFDDSKITLGIYGIGKYTSELLKIYDTYVGEIKARIVYIKSSDQVINEPNTIYPCDANTECDYILISSIKYSKVMRQQLTICEVPDEKIITIYDGKEIFDVISLSRVLVTFNK